MSKFGDLGSKFLKTNVRFEISTIKIEHRRNFVKIRKLILFGSKCPNLSICTQTLKIESRKFKIFPVLKFWIVSGCFAFSEGRFGCFGSFWLVSSFWRVLDRFELFQVLVIWKMTSEASYLQ